MSHFLNNVIKYLIIVGLIYYIIKVVPSEKICTRDILLLLAVIVCGFVLTETIFMQNINVDTFDNISTKLDSFRLTHTPTASEIYADNNNSIVGVYDTKNTNVNYNTSQINSVGVSANNDINHNGVNNVNNAANNAANNAVNNSNNSNNGVNNNGLKNMQHINQTVMSESNNFMKTSCGVEVEKMKQELAEEINKLKNIALNTENEQAYLYSGTIPDRYLNTLIAELKERDLLNDFDISNIRLKLKNKVVALMDMITYLENMKKDGVNHNKKSPFNNDNDYNELPTDFMKPIGSGIANDWDNDYAILDTNKWAVPMERPPVCINSKNDFGPMESSDKVLKLKEWNNSLKISDKLNLNKKWLNNS